MLSSIHQQEWTHAVCVVVPKKRKAILERPTAYRPISLLSCFGKILETVLSKRVYNVARRTGAISENKMGSILHHSATDTLTVTLTPVTAAIFMRLNSTSQLLNTAITKKPHYSPKMLAEPLIIQIQMSSSKS
jgi:hypothetical protein